MVKTSLIFRLVVLSSVLLLACLRSKEIKEDDLVGTYSFEYPSGEVELLIGDRDASYRKDIYRTDYDFQTKSSPAYTNQGTRTILQRNEIEFDHWLEYCDSRDPRVVVSEPSHVTMLNTYWTKQFGSEAEIMIYDETGYVFKETD